MTASSAALSLLNSTTDPADTTAPLGEPSLFYDPPYDSPLDDAVAWHLVKYLASTQGLQYQATSSETDCALPLADFLIEGGSRRVALMITDGSTGERDRLRDALWIGSGSVDAVARFRAVDLEHRLPDALLLLARWMPDLFSDRGRTNLSTLASPVARQHTPTWSTPEDTLHYDDADAHVCTLLDASSSPRDTLVVRRLMRQQPDAWCVEYKRAMAAGSCMPRRAARVA